MTEVMTCPSKSENVHGCIETDERILFSGGQNGVTVRIARNPRVYLAKIRIEPEKQSPNAIFLQHSLKGNAFAPRTAPG